MSNITEYILYLDDGTEYGSVSADLNGVNMDFEADSPLTGTEAASLGLAIIRAASVHQHYVDGYQKLSED